MAINLQSIRLVSVKVLLIGKDNSNQSGNHSKGRLKVMRVRFEGTYDIS